MKLYIANRRYSSWSLRGWLAAKQSGLPFEEVMVDIYADGWAAQKTEGVFGEGNSRVPILEDDGAVVWNALAIIDWLDRKSGGTKFWPTEPKARAFATSIAAEMQAGFLPLRQNCPMNCMRHYPGWTVAPDAEADVARIDWLWRTAIERFGGPWLGGAEWGGADILFSAVVSRLTTYDVKLSPLSDAYRARAIAHPLVAEWIAAAADETRLLPHYEF
ncbi:glutathione S-transferase [Sandaracinobacteroides hominis]|uniref:glutathione S-transferase n=1 Tax=Sandaracinobacteroides hominis TaxID=2780086 RepID=UPI0018F71FB2|nr:glutathione S-transferase [Sandaracinobacteroides hominis]